MNEKYSSIAQTIYAGSNNFDSLIRMCELQCISTNTDKVEKVFIFADESLIGLKVVIQ